MVDGVHDNAADGRTDAEVAFAAGLADVDVLMLAVADRSDVARQLTETMRTSPDGRRTCA
jgi:hypothetical protein